MHLPNKLLKTGASLWVILMLTALSGANPSSAQTSAIVWTRPINLSNSPESSGRPAIVADGYGYVHVFWSEDVGGKSILNIPGQMIGTGNTIFYTRWDGASWTQPIDILFVPGEDIAEYVAATVDQRNQIHLVWTGQSNFYYSTAPAQKAYSAHSWSTPVVVATGSARTQWESDIVVDASGNIHIAYATGGDGASVYHVNSTDGGASWQTPTQLSGALDQLEEAFSNVRIITDGAQRLHVIWGTVQAQGFGQGIYYARSVDRGATWSAPVRMAYKDAGEYGVTFPSIASVGKSELHMIYVDGPWHIGRYHRISRDGGETLSAPSHVFTDFEGINGYPIFLVDGSGGLHLVITWRTRTQVGCAVCYARWSGTTWSPMELAVPETQTWPGAHWTAATMRLGNEIHVVFNTNFSDKAGEIWYVQGRLPGVAQDPVLPPPRPEKPTPESTLVPATPGRKLVSATPLSAAMQEQPSSNPLSPLSATVSVQLVAISSPVLLVIAAVMLWAQRRP